MPRYTTDRAIPGLVAFYNIRPGNGAGQFLQPRSPHGAILIWDCQLQRGKNQTYTGTCTDCTMWLHYTNMYIHTYIYISPQYNILMNGEALIATQTNCKQQTKNTPVKRCSKREIMVTSTRHLVKRELQAEKNADLNNGHPFIVPRFVLTRREMISGGQQLRHTSQFI